MNRVSVQVKPFDYKPESKFIKIRKLQSIFGGVLGIDASKGHREKNKIQTNIILQFITQLIIYGYILFLYLLMIEAHIDARAIFSVDLFVLCSSTLTFILSVHAFILFKNRFRIEDLLNQCENLGHTPNGFKPQLTTPNDSIIKLTQALLKLSYANPIFYFCFVVITLMCTQDVVYAFPTYESKYWEKSLLSFVVINGGYILLTFLFNRILFCTFSLFTILVYYVTSEFKCLSVILLELSQSKHIQNANSTSTILNQIIERHSNLIQMVKDVDKIFSIPLLTSEMFCIICIPLVGFTLFYVDDCFNVALGAIFVVFFKLSYCVYGQQIIDSAFEFEMALHNSNWLVLDPNLRRTLLFSIRIAQKPIGISSGGFHFINHSQMTKVNYCSTKSAFKKLNCKLPFQIITRGYNLLICVIKFA